MTADNPTTRPEQTRLLERILEAVRSIEQQLEHLADQLADQLEELAYRRDWPGGGYDLSPPRGCNGN